VSTSTRVEQADDAIDRAPSTDRRRAMSNGFHWMTYAQAAAYTGWSIVYLRNLVSAGQIPVFGRSRVRRFRRDMLDLFLADPDEAMRRFRSEGNTHGR
jgi:hypothetical protein